jgi:hypothetical protein
MTTKPRETWACAMKRMLCLLVALPAAGCLSFIPDDMLVNGYNDVHDVPSFWVRTWEIGARDEGVDYAGLPVAFKHCTGSEAVKMSPPALTEAVERFIADKNVGNYEALLPMVRKFASGYEEAYGVKPGIRAGELCKDKLQAT